MKTEDIETLKKFYEMMQFFKQIQPKLWREMMEENAYKFGMDLKLISFRRGKGRKLRKYEPNKP